MKIADLIIKNEALFKVFDSVWESSFRVFIKNESVHVIYLLYLIAEKRRLHKKKINKEKLKEHDIIKASKLFLFQNTKEIENWKSKNLFFAFFQFLEFILFDVKYKRSDLDDFLNECLKHESFDIKDECKKFIKNTEHIKDKRILTKHISDIPVEERNINSEVVSEYIDGFLMNNSIKQISNNYFQYVFEIEEGYSKLKNLKQLWLFSLKIKDLNILKTLTDFLTILYKSFPLHASKSFIKAMFKNFTDNFCMTIEELINKDDHDSYKKIDKFIEFFISFFNSIINPGEEREPTNISYSINFKYNQRVQVRRLNANTTLLEFLDRVANRDRDRYIIEKEENLNLNYFSLYERITAYHLDLEIKEGAELKIIPYSKFFDVEFYRKYFKDFLSEYQTFFYTIKELQSVHSDVFSVNLGIMISLVSIHKHNLNFFKKSFSRKDFNKDKTLMFQTTDLFEHSLYNLLNVMKDENAKNKRVISNLIKKNHLKNFIFLFFENKVKKSKNIKMTILKIIIEAVNFKKGTLLTSFKASDGFYKFLLRFLSIPVGLEFDKTTTDNEIIIKNLFSLYFLNSKTIKTILSDINEEIHVNPESGQDIIITTLDILDIIPGEEIYAGEINDIVDVKNLNQKKESSLILLAFVLKFYRTNKLNYIDKERIIGVLISNILVIKKRDLNSEILLRTIKLLAKYFSSLDRLKKDLSDLVDDWIEFYILRVNREEESHDDYFTLSKNSKNLKILFDLLKNYTRISFNNEKIITAFSTFIQFQKNRGDSKRSWNISTYVPELGKVNKFRGLVNLGSTCYINSCIQQLYMIEGFSGFVINIEADEEEEEVLYNVG